MRDRSFRVGVTSPTKHGSLLSVHSSVSVCRDKPQKQRDVTPHAADAMSYALGFVIATGLLHLCGIAVGALVRWPSGTMLVRGAGGLIAVAGGAFLSGVM